MPADSSSPVDRRSYWNDRYHEEPDRYGDDPNQFVFEVAGSYSPGTVLDVACGRGRNAVWLAAQGHTVTAVDISDVGIEQGRALAARRGVSVEWIRADFMTWSPAASGYDLVLLSYLQLPEELRVRAHRRAAAAVASGGRLLLVAHHSDNLAHGIGGPDNPDVLYDEAMLAGDFVGLDLERNEKVIRRVDRSDVAGDAVDILYVGSRPRLADRLV